MFARLQRNAIAAAAWLFPLAGATRASLRPNVKRRLDGHRAAFFSLQTQKPNHRQEGSNGLYIRPRTDHQGSRP
jgi:hypothetical protein